MSDERISISVENGVNWIRRYRKRPGDPLQQTNPPHYLATYKCNLCGHFWQDHANGSFPLSEKRCIISACGKPSFIRLFIRSIKKQKTTGIGKLVRVDAYLWEP